MEKLIMIICSIFCGILGSLITLFIMYGQTYGVLVIDNSGEKSNWSFVVERPLDDFEKHKLVIFKVKRK